MNHMVQAFSDTIENLLGIELEILDRSTQHCRRFENRYSFNTIIDFSGSIIGYMCISTQADTLVQLLELSEDNEADQRIESTSFINEALNTICGETVPLIKDTYPLVTITSPRRLIGEIQFPPNPCIVTQLKTNHGTFELCYGTDAMGLDVIELLDTIKDQKEEIELQRNELKEIFDHIDLLLLKIDQNAIVMPGYSESCKTFFNKEHIERSSFLELLDFKDNIELKEEFALWVSASFSIYKKMEWSKLEKLCPIEHFKVGERHLKINFQPIALDGELQRLLVIAKDVTAMVEMEKTLEMERESHDREIGILKQMLSYSSNDIQIFLKEVQDQMEVISAVVSGEDYSESRLVLAKRSTHTIKGNAGLYQMDTLGEIAHKLETTFNLILSDQNLEENIQNMHLYTEQLKALAEQLFTWGEKLQIYSPEGKLVRKISIQQEELKNLLVQLDGLKNDKQQHSIDELKGFCLQKLTVPLDHIQDRLQKVASYAGQKCNKEVNSLEFLGGETRVHPKIAEFIINPLTHVIKNSVDHGIEPPDVRRQKDKASAGRVQISFDLKDDQLHINIQDDGRGFDAEHIYKQYLSMGNAELQGLSEQEKIQLITSPQFSTAENSTEISGSGVGLTIVHEKIKELGGQLIIDHAEPPFSAQLSLLIPYHLEDHL